MACRRIASLVVLNSGIKELILQVLLANNITIQHNVYYNTNISFCNILIFSWNISLYTDI